MLMRTMNDFKKYQYQAMKEGAKVWAQARLRQKKILRHGQLSKLSLCEPRIHMLCRSRNKRLVFFATPVV